MWIKYDNRAGGDGSEQRHGGGGLILGVADRECVVGGGLTPPTWPGCVLLNICRSLFFNVKKLRKK